MIMETVMLVLIVLVNILEALYLDVMEYVAAVLKMTRVVFAGEAIPLPMIVDVLKEQFYAKMEANMEIVYQLIGLVMDGVIVTVVQMS